MRTHTTSTLRNLIKVSMNAENASMSAHEIDQWKQALPMIYYEMIESIRFFTHGIFDRKLVRRQIIQIHKEVVSLLDAADKLQGLSDELIILKQRVIQCLEQLLDYLLEHCDKFLDPEQSIPMLHLRKEKVNMQSNVDALEAKMKQLAVEVALQKAVMEPFHVFLGKGRSNYQTFRYTTELLTALKVCCAESTKLVVHDRIPDRLMMLNFNSEAFIGWYERYIQQGLSALYEVAEQHRYLDLYEHQFKFPPYRKHWSYYDRRRRRTYDLMHEIVLREQGKLPDMRIVPVESSNARAEVLPYRIRTAFSVDALAYFIRLLVEAKVIESGIRTELLSFVSRSFTTPGTGSNGISATSLGSRYKQVVQTTAMQVRAALMRMVGLIDAEFG